MTPLDYPPTEVGNAQRLAAELNGDARWHPGRGWLVWCGTHWALDEYLVQRKAQESARVYLIEAITTGSNEQRKWGLMGESERVLRAVVNILKSIPGTVIREDELDLDPWLLNCLNGTIDLRTGNLREHRREDRITMCAPSEYDEKGNYEDWGALMSKCHPDYEIANYLQLLVGYGITGLTREQMFVLHIGSGANGKGTFMHGLTSALGEYTKTARVVSFLKARNELGSGSASPDVMALAGRRLVFAEEPDVTAKLDEGKLKNLTGEGRISGRGLYKEETEFEPKFLLQLLTNHLPTVWGRDEGIWRRIKVIEWTQDFSKDRDMGLYERVASWRNQILTWCVHGAAQYYQAGRLMTPNKVSEAGLNYRKENDRLDGWFPGLWGKDPSEFTPRAVLANDYATWVRAEHGEEARVMQSKFLYQALRAAGVEETMMSGVRGFRLKDLR